MKENNIVALEEECKVYRKGQINNVSYWLTDGTSMLRTASEYIKSAISNKLFRKVNNETQTY